MAIVIELTDDELKNNEINIFNKVRVQNIETILMNIIVLADLKKKKLKPAFNNQHQSF